jgi:hypothetical protein
LQYKEGQRKQLRKNKDVCRVSSKMGCPALGVSVTFLKQPALPGGGEAPQTKKISKKILKNKNH